MKPTILLLCLISLALSAFAQDGSSTLELRGIELHKDEPFIDTVPAILLCADTAHYTHTLTIGTSDAESNNYLLNSVQTTYWIHGHIVRNHFCPKHSADFFIWNEKLSVEYIKYLDEKKRPLKDILVFQVIGR